MATIEQLQAQINELKENAEFTEGYVENLRTIMTWLLSHLSNADEAFLNTLQTFLANQTSKYEKIHGQLQDYQYEFFDDFAREVAEKIKH